MTPAEHHTQHRKRSGFSLIELLLVAFIFGVGLLGLTALMASSLRAGGGGRQRDTAAYLANNALEALAADGLTSSILRNSGQAIPASAQLANVADDAANAFQLPDEGGTLCATFDMEGRPSATNPVFSVQWVRRATKSTTSLASSGVESAEVLVNVSWMEPGPANVTLPKWLSFSRTIRF